MTDRVIGLSGLHGQNPLGFFAALGLLRILDAHARTTSMTRPTLSFFAMSPFAARIVFNATMEQIKEIVLNDAVAQEASVALRLAYDKAGELCPPDALGATRDLKPRPPAARRFLERAVGAVRRDADLAAGMLSDVVQDNNGASKPTAFHFTAGHTTVPTLVEQIQLVNRDGLLERLH